jgi:hypothetical protein
MAALRPIEWEPKSSDERTESKLRAARLSRAHVVRAGRLTTNSLATGLAGRRTGGVALKGGNPGPVGVSTTVPTFS